MYSKEEVNQLNFSKRYGVLSSIIHLGQSMCLMTLKENYTLIPISEIFTCIIKYLFSQTKSFLLNRYQCQIIHRHSKLIKIASCERIDNLVLDAWFFN